MTLLAAGGVATILSLTTFTVFFALHGIPWLTRQTRSDALVALLWVHAFRHIALQIFSAQRLGLAVSDIGRNHIAYGDVAGMLLVLAAIVALYRRSSWSITLVWVFVAETVYDLVDSTIIGIRENLFETVAGLTWLILTFYVPLLWLTLALIIWQLLVRRAEPLGGARVIT
jgi:hypothetical protein